MGAEHSQQRLSADRREFFEGQGSAALNRDKRYTTAAGGSTNGAHRAAALNANAKRYNNKQQNNAGTSNSNKKREIVETASPTTSELSRPPSPPLSVCSDLPYVSYTDRPIGDSPKLRNKPQGAMARAQMRQSYPGGAKPKRPQSTGSGSIVIVKPGTSDNDYDIDPDLARLRALPHFLPILRESTTSATLARDPEVLERIQAQHLQNICSRMQQHLNLCATHVSTEQNHLVERTKVVSNSITTLFASFVDMQKTYAAYAEQFTKIRAISQQLSRCNSLLHDNIESLEAINNFLDVEDRLEPFVWRTDDNRLRGEAEGAVGGGSGRVTRM